MKTDFCIFDLKAIKMWKRFSQSSLENNINYLLGLGYTCINVYSDILTDIYIEVPKNHMVLGYFLM